MIEDERDRDPLSVPTNIETESTEEEIIPIMEERPSRKKVTALKARHELEDYFEMKKLSNSLDYLFEDQDEE